MLRDAIDTHGIRDIGTPVAPRYFRFSDRQEALGLLSGAGLGELRFEVVPLLWRLPSPQAMFDAFYQGEVRAAALLRNQSPEAIEAIRAALLQGAEAFRQGDGVEVPMGAALSAGVKP